jgi:hypothetical protein
MPGAHRDVALVQHLRDVVRMHALQIKGQYAEPALSGSEQFEAGDTRQPIDAVAGQRLFVLEDVVAPHFLDKVERSTQPDRTGNVRGPGLEPVRRVLVLGFLEADVQDHAPVIPKTSGTRLIGISRSELTTMRLAVDSPLGSMTGNIRMPPRA